jgi:hypothetical protein
MELSPSWEAANCAATQEIISAFYGTRRFITVFTRAIHPSLSWARSIKAIPSYPISLRFILILYTHLPLVLPSGLFPSGFPTNILPHSCYMPCPSHPLWLDHSNYTSHHRKFICTGFMKEWNVRFLTKVNITAAVFWELTPWSLVDGYQIFRRNLQSRGTRILLWEAIQHVPRQHTSK